MTFWKRLRLIGSVIVFALAIVATVGALMHPAPPVTTDTPAREPVGLPGSQANGTKGL
jgi:hypothetical protein